MVNGPFINYVTQNSTHFDPLPPLRDIVLNPIPNASCIKNSLKTPLNCFYYQSFIAKELKIDSSLIIWWAKF